MLAGSACPRTPASGADCRSPTGAGAAQVTIETPGLGEDQACWLTRGVLPLSIAKRERAGLGRGRIARAPGPLSSVEVASRSDQYAFDSQYAAERLEVAVVVQNPEATLRRRGGDQIVGGGKSALARELA